MYTDYETARRRTDLLALLNGDHDKRSTEGLIRERLEVEYGYRLAHVDLRRDLAWLEEQQLILVHRYQDGQLWIAELRRAGQDVAERRAPLPGGRIEAAP